MYEHTLNAFQNQGQENKHEPKDGPNPNTIALTQMEEEVTEARALLERILQERKNTLVDLEPAGVQAKCGTCTYHVSFSGFQVTHANGFLFCGVEPYCRTNEQ